VKTKARSQGSERTYLLKLFELTEQMDRNGASLVALEQSLELANSEGTKILESLVEMGMIVWPSKGMVMLTEQGLALFGKEHENTNQAEQSYLHRMPRARERRSTMANARLYSHPRVGSTHDPR
jgi:Mn-dependent DtxR family transcriptional regulator